MKQLRLLKNEKSAYGGELLNTREGRTRGRPLDTKNTMHLVLRSSKAKGVWSFQRKQNPAKIKSILRKFGTKYGVNILSLANVGNHLHLQVKLSNRHTYRSFIRAITAAIAMAVTGVSRWSVLKNSATLKKAQTLKKSTNANSTNVSPPNQTAQPISTKLRFWDYRPFSRVVVSRKGFLNLRDYIRINQLEGMGYKKVEARYILVQQRAPCTEPNRTNI